MKKILIMILAAASILFLSTEDAHAQINPETQYLGKAAKDFDWAQGVVMDGEDMYVLDGNDIKLIQNKKSKSYFHIDQLKPLLEPYGLGDAMTLRSFLLTQMEMHKGKLYVSGLVYKDTQADKQMWDYNLVSGETHTVVFVVEKGKAKLIHSSLTYHNRVSQLGDFYETASGQREDVIKWDDGLIVAYGKYIAKPRFTFTDKGDLLYVFQRETGKTNGAALDIVLYQNNTKQVIHSIPTYEENYTIPTLKGNTLTLYYRQDSRIDPYSMKMIDLKTKKVTGIPAPHDMLLERPIYRNGIMYFLTDAGVFSIDATGKHIKAKWLLDAKNVNLNVLIAGWDYDGKHIYITDFNRRAVHKIKP